MHEPLACVICGRVPEPAFPEQPPWAEGVPVQPYGATVFVAYGQYGPTAVDPLPDVSADGGGSNLQINICDQCLLAVGEQGRVALVERMAPPKSGAFPLYKYHPWKGGENDDQ